MKLNKHSLSQGESKKSFKMYKRKKQWVVAPVLLAMLGQLAAAPIASIGLFGPPIVVSADSIADTDVTAFNAYKQAAITEVNAITKLSAADKKTAVDEINALTLTVGDNDSTIASQKTLVDTAVLKAYKSVGTSVSEDFVKIYTDKAAALVEAGLTGTHEAALGVVLGDEAKGTGSLANFVGTFTAFEDRVAAKAGLALALSKLQNQIDDITPYLDAAIATYTEIAKEDKYIADQSSLEAKKQAALAIVDTLVTAGLSPENANTAKNSINNAEGVSAIGTALDTARSALASDLVAAEENAKTLAAAKTKAKNGLSQLTHLSATQVADYKAQIDAAKTTDAVALIVGFEDETVNNGTAKVENDRLGDLVGLKSTAKTAVDELTGLSTTQKTSFKAQIDTAKNEAEINVIKKKAFQADTLAKASAANNLGKIDDLLKIFFGSGKNGNWTVADDGLSTPAAGTEFGQAALAATTSAELVKVISDAYNAANTAADSVLVNGTGEAGATNAGIETLIQTGGQANLDIAQGKIDQLSDTAKKVELQAKLDAAQALLTAKTNAKVTINELVYATPAEKATAFTAVDTAKTVEEVETVVTAAQKADWKIADTPVKALIQLYVADNNLDAAKKELANIKDPETKAELEKLIAAAENPIPVLSGLAHIQDFGNRTGTLTNNALYLGTKGQSKRLEAVTLSVAGVTGLKYQVHVQNKGWLNSVTDGQEAGTRGQSLRLEAIKIELTGDLADKYDVYYRVHVQNEGDQAWKSNGEQAGTTGRALRLEALQVVLVAKGEKPATNLVFG